MDNHTEQFKTTAFYKKLLSCFQKEDIESVLRKKNEFNNFMSKVPPTYELTLLQKETGLNAENKKFIVHVLYLLPERVRKDLFINEHLLNKIINVLIYHPARVGFKNIIGDLSKQSKKEIFFETWVLYELYCKTETIFTSISEMLESVSNFLVEFDSKVMEESKSLQECFLDVFENKVINLNKKPSGVSDSVYSYMISSFSVFFNNLDPNKNDLYSKFEKILIASKEIENITLSNDKLFFDDKEMKDTFNSFNVNEEMVELIGSFSQLPESMHGNKTFVDAMILNKIFSSFIHRLSIFGWTIPEKPLLEIDDFKQLLMLLVIISNKDDENVHAFISEFLTLAYLALFVSDTGESVYFDSRVKEIKEQLMVYIGNFVTGALEVSIEENKVSTTQPLTKEKEITLNPEVTGTEITPVSNQPFIAESDISEVTKENTMTAQTSTPTVSTEAIVATVFEQINKDVVGKLEKLTSDNAKFKTDVLEAVEALSKKTTAHNTSSNAAEVNTLASEIEKTLARIRKEAEATTQVRETVYYSPSLTTTETVILSVVALTAVAAVGYSIYKFLEE